MRVRGVELLDLRLARRGHGQALLDQRAPHLVRDRGPSRQRRRMGLGERSEVGGAVAAEARRDEPAFGGRHLGRIDLYRLALDEPLEQQGEGELAVAGDRGERVDVRGVDLLRGAG